MSYTCVRRSQVILSILIISMLISRSLSLQILGLFPHPGASHFRSAHAILLGLAKAGHNVTVVSHYPDRSAPNNYEDLVIEGEKPMLNSIDLAVKYRENCKHACVFVLLTLYFAVVC